MKNNNKHHLKGLRVLVVDDDKLMRNFVSTILKFEGAHVACAESGPSALRICEQEKYDVAILDLRMPGMDGVSSAAGLRRILPELITIAMSSNTPQDQSMDIASFSSFIPKPITKQGIVDLILSLKNS